MSASEPLTLRERAEALGLRLLLFPFSLLPMDMAAALGGWIARAIGPRLGISRRARRNLRLALPELPPDRHEQILCEMWDNLGRIAAEYPHLPKLLEPAERNRIEIVGAEHVAAAGAGGRAVLLISGHFANWEIACIAAPRYARDVLQVYRAVNNRAIDRMIFQYRQNLGVEPVRKGAAGAKRLIAGMRAGRAVAMLIDQKMNDGIAVPFFGRPAMTAPAAADFALRYHAAFIPCRIDRLSGVRFRMTLFPPLPVPEGPDRHANVQALMAAANGLLESWIRERPGSWFWLHRRWPES
jgi:Kdo2-lipid IVA lauroyltransferase/acyltransferase